MIIDNQALKVLAALPSSQVTLIGISAALPQRSQQWQDRWAIQLIQVIHDYDRTKLSGIEHKPIAVPALLLTDLVNTLY